MVDPGTAEPYLVDGGDLECAKLLIRLRREVAGLPAGTVVHLRATDPIAPIDLPAWCHLTGHHWLGEVPSPDGMPTYAIRVARDAVPTDPERPWHRPAPSDC